MELYTAVETETRPDPDTGREDGALLAAALTALLLEHQRQTAATDGTGGLPGGPSQWQVMARWEQLRGQA